MTFPHQTRERTDHLADEIPLTKLPQSAGLDLHPPIDHAGRPNVQNRR
jgi:hypothetical protein